MERERREVVVVIPVFRPHTNNHTRSLTTSCPALDLLTVFQLHAYRLMHPLTPTHCSSFHLTNIAWSHFTVLVLQGTTDFILCREGHCQFISKEDVKLLELDEKKEKKKVEESCSSKPPPVVQTEKEKESPPPPATPLEVATIAVTEDDASPGRGEGQGAVPDDPLPDILIKPQPDLKSFKVRSLVLAVSS